MPGSVADGRAHKLSRRYTYAFGGAEFPIAVESIAEDLLGPEVERRELEVSGMLFPAERRILLNAGESKEHQRFTIAYEVGHWVCQCLEGGTKPVYCPVEDMGVDNPGAKALKRGVNARAAELPMPEEAVRETDGTEDIAARFGVSDEAMTWRRHNFGLIEARPL